MSSELMIAGRRIGAAHAPFVIAEMSGNHYQSLRSALDIVEAAATAGAHALGMACADHAARARAWLSRAAGGVDSLVRK